MRKILFSLTIAGVALAASSCSSNDSPNVYKVDPLGTAGEYDYHECIVVTKYDNDFVSMEKLSASRIYCLEENAR